MMPTPRSEIEKGFLLLKEYFDKLDMRTIEKKGGRVFDTTHGIYGPTGLFDAFELFRRIELEKSRSLVDLGSGDGRIALVAALFTQSYGIEADQSLHELAVEAKQALLPSIPTLARCKLLCSDYTTEDLTPHDVFFIYADHAWDAAFEKKLSQECEAVILSYNNIFSPQTLKKGRTIWIEQIPIVTYELSRR